MFFLRRSTRCRPEESNLLVGVIPVPSKRSPIGRLYFNLAEDFQLCMEMAWIVLMPALIALNESLAAGRKLFLQPKKMH
jgi:hypothetical protein